MIFCMEMRHAHVSGRIHRWFVAISRRKPAPTHFTGFYPATYPDFSIQMTVREKQTYHTLCELTGYVIMIDEIKTGEEEE